MSKLLLQNDVFWVGVFLNYKTLGARVMQYNRLVVPFAAKGMEKGEKFLAIKAEHRTP